MLLTLFFFLATVLLSEPAAAQASTTNCGAAVCSVSTTARGESNWASVYRSDYRAAHGNVTVPNPNVRTFRSPCSYWLPSSGGTSVKQYPAQRSGSYTCNFFDGGAVGGGTWGILFQCAPRGDRAANGRLDYYVRLTDGSLYYSHYRCLYPTDAYAPVERKTGEGKVYTGGRGDFYLSDASSARRHGGSGSRTDTTGYIDRKVDLRYPERYTGSWQPSFNAKTGVTASGEPRYGYYRLDWELHYRLCSKWQYPSWLGQPTRVDCSTRGTDRPSQPYTYACDSTPALAAGIRSGAAFDPSQCVSSWSCDISDHIRVGGFTGNVSVLRNGESSTVTWNRRGVHDPGKRVEVTSWQQRSTPLDSATPRNPQLSDDNHRDQYFQASWDWGKWQTIREEGELYFYWASDPGAPFRWDTEYRLHGRFLVPAQTSLNGGTESRWVTDSHNCGSFRSPSVAVLRSVNTP